MKLQIGENIRIFRKTKDMTQEQLSEMLGVSCQSVSRWESGACYPDMELLPLLSDIFEVTVDRLLGVDEIAEKKNVDVYLNRFQAAISCGDAEKCIAIAREGVAEYPNNYMLLNKLMYALFLSGDDDGNNPNWRENMQKYDGEITSLGERIMQYCPDINLRLEAAARLAFNHCEMGRREIGRKVYETLPTFDNCRELNIMPSLTDDEKLPHARALVRKGYEMMYSGLYMMTREKLLSDKKTAMVFDKIDELNSVVYDNNVSPNGWSAANHHCKLAEVYARLNRNADVINELKLAAEYARKFDSRPDEITSSSLLLGKFTERKTDFETGDSRTLCKIMRDKWLKSHDFDSVRNSADFDNIVNMLSE